MEYFTLQDLIDIAHLSGNDNPGIFLLNIRKDESDYTQACPLEDIFVDEDGDIILKSYCVR